MNVCTDYLGEYTVRRDLILGKFKQIAICYIQRLEAFRIFLGILLFDKRFLKIFQKFSSPLFLRRKKNLFFCNNFF